MEERGVTTGDARGQLPADKDDFLARYVDAFERYDVDELVTLLHEDVVLSMPPYSLWMQGRDNFAGWLLGTGKGCRGSKLLPTTANGLPAFGQYRRGEVEGTYVPWSLQVLEFEDGRVIADSGPLWIKSPSWMIVRPRGTYPLLGLQPSARSASASRSACPPISPKMARRTGLFT